MTWGIAIQLMLASTSLYLCTKAWWLCRDARRCYGHVVRVLDGIGEWDDLRAVAREMARELWPNWQNCDCIQCAPQEDLYARAREAGLLDEEEVGS